MSTIYDFSLLDTKLSKRVKPSTRSRGPSFVDVGPPRTQARVDTCGSVRTHVNTNLSANPVPTVR